MNSVARRLHAVPHGNFVSTGAGSKFCTPKKKGRWVQRRSFPQVDARARVRGASWGVIFHPKRGRCFRRGLAEKTVGRPDVSS